MTSDYLIVGAGAMGMAFADVIANESDATMTIVDRHARPGGHWNDSYPFVRLHQPSSFYGVNSRALGNDTIDQVGLNAGLYELASGTEVVTYFDQVMREQLLPTGRVRYLPRHDYLGDGRIRSLVTGNETTLDAARTVDATYMNVRVPSQTTPSFTAADGVRCVPLNELPEIDAVPEQWVVVGAGKTGMDAVLWLLTHDVDPDHIRWIMPRDSWILDRAKIQPGPDFADGALANFAAQVESSAKAESIDDLFVRLEAAGCLLRIDPAVTPTMYRCATCTTDEIEQLRRVHDVVRMGRVQAIEADRIVLEHGEVPAGPNTLYVHCAADGLERRPDVPVFDGDRITLQTVRHCQQVFSAAFIAHVDVAYADEARKNELATVVPHPNTATDWLRTALGNSLNGARWREDAELTAWLTTARLDGFSSLRSGEAATPAQQQSLESLFTNALDSVVNLQRLIAEAEAAEATETAG
ncbi:MAG: NAD(P)-binding protein [Actinomycetota bacterium]